MGIYRARVATENGTEILTLSAHNGEEAHSLAQESGLVLSCRRTAALLSRIPLTSEEREQLLTQLSFLLSSGIGTSQALSLIKQNSAGRIESVCAQLLRYIEEGDNLDVAIERIGAPDFPPAVMAMVESGFRSGEATASLEAAAQFEAELRELKESAGSRIVSAFIGFLTSTFFTLLSVFYFGPKVLDSDLIRAGGDAVSVAWANVLGYGIGALMGALFFFVVFILYVHFVIRRFLPLGADKITMAIPVWREIALSKEKYLSFHGVAAMIHSGVSLDEAFRTLAGSTPDGVLRSELVGAREAVHNGRPWVDAFSSMSAIDLAALKNANDRKQIADAFRRLSKAHKKAYAQALRKAGFMLELTSALCLTLAGVVIFALTVLPMLQASAGIL